MTVSLCELDDSIQATGTPDTSEIKFDFSAKIIDSLTVSPMVPYHYSKQGHPRIASCVVSCINADQRVSEFSEHLRLKSGLENQTEQVLGYARSWGREI